MSSMKLEKNGQANAGKRSQHLHIKYFFFTEQIEKGTVQIQYCPTDDMIADYMTKPLVGRKFTYFRDIVLNTTSPVKQQECIRKLTNDNYMGPDQVSVNHNDMHPK